MKASPGTYNFPAAPWKNIGKAAIKTPGIRWKTPRCSNFRTGSKACARSTCAKISCGAHIRNSFVRDIMKEQVVSFQSAGLRLHGVLGVREGLQASGRRAAFLVLHGFGSNSESSNVLGPTRVLSEFGYVTLRFDM